MNRPEIADNVQWLACLLRAARIRATWGGTRNPEDFRDVYDDIQAEHMREAFFLIEKGVQAPRPKRPCAHEWYQMGPAQAGLAHWSCEKCLETRIGYAPTDGVVHRAGGA